MDSTPGTIDDLVLQVIDPKTREYALSELSKMREAYPDLAPILWHSFGTISTLLQEIVDIYPCLSPPELSHQSSQRVCNALALLQCIASHAETRTLFLNGESIFVALFYIQVFLFFVCFLFVFIAVVNSFRFPFPQFPLLILNYLSFSISQLFV